MVDGPDGGYVRVEELWEGAVLPVGLGARQPGLAHGIVPHQDTFDQLLVGLLVLVHEGRWWPTRCTRTSGMKGIINKPKI